MVWDGIVVVQITNIRVVKEAMQEAAYMYAELQSMGAPMAYLDVGGGLAIDYDGSKTDSANSLSYTTQQYANDVIATVKVSLGFPVLPRLMTKKQNLSRTQSLR